jgi:hypothetical protein
LSLQNFHALLANVPDNIRHCLIINHNPKGLALLIQTLLYFSMACLLSIICLTSIEDMVKTQGRFVRLVAQAGQLLQRLNEILSISHHGCIRAPTSREETIAVQLSTVFHDLYTMLGQLPARVTMKLTTKPYTDHLQSFKLLSLVNTTLSLTMAIPSACYTNQDNNQNADLLNAALLCVNKAQTESVFS